MHLLTLQQGRWQRTALRDDAPAPFPPTAHNGPPALLLSAPPARGQPLAFLIAPPAARLFVNAEPRPCLPVTALQPHDRITLHLPTGEVARAWLLPAPLAAATAAPAPSAVCGYCAAPLADAAPAPLVCAACGETVHADCAAHYAAHAPGAAPRACPRCAAPLLPDPLDWRPDGFKEDADDEEWDD